METKLPRNISGVFFRAERDGKWENICFEELTEEEQNRVMEGRSGEWLASLCKHLASELLALAVFTGITKNEDAINEHEDDPAT